MRVPKQRKTIEVTARQIAGAMFVIVIILTVTFYVGVNAGKKKVINAEVEAQKYDELMALSRIAQAVDRAKDAIHHEEKSQKNEILADTTLNIKQVSGRTMQSGKKPEQEKLSKINSTPTLEEKIEEQRGIKSEEPEKKVLYTVKLGTFGSEENAIKLSNLLKELSYNAEIKSDGKFFHVTIGEFPNKDEAKKFGDELVNKLPSIESYLIKEL